MEDKPLSPKWFIQAMALLAVAGITIPLIAGVAGFLKDEVMRLNSVEKAKRGESFAVRDGNEIAQGLDEMLKKCS